MAAAEYYNPNAGRQPAPAVQYPQAPPRIQAHPPPQSHASQLPYPISDAPPPYTPYAEGPRPHSQPPPQSRVRFDDEQRPQPIHGILKNSNTRPPTNSYNTNEKLRPPPPQGYPTSQPQAPSSHPQQYSTQQSNGYYPGPAQQAAPESYGYRPTNLTPQPYYPQERSRSRSHDRRHRHHHSHRHRDDRNRDEAPQKKKGSSVNTFLGAGGGALIGDAIFPGLGTLGGAILGGLGGHKYTEQRKSYGKDSRIGHHRSYSSTEADYYDNEDYGRGRRH